MLWRFFKSWIVVAACLCSATARRAIAALHPVFPTAHLPFGNPTSTSAQPPPRCLVPCPHTERGCPSVAFFSTARPKARTPFAPAVVCLPSASATTRAPPKAPPFPPLPNGRAHGFAEVRSAFVPRCRDTTRTTRLLVGRTYYAVLHRNWRPFSCHLEAPPWPSGGGEGCLRAARRRMRTHRRAAR